jgi:anaerobic selenocysteine-containing dehydrogenase
MTPTAVAFADLVLPAAMSCERNSIRAWWTPLRAISQATSYYEAKSDEAIIIELGKRLAPEIFGKFENDIDYLNWNLTEDGTYPGDYIKLREEVFDFWDFLYNYRKYETGKLREDGEPGFSSPTGKFELSVTLFEAADYDSVPYHVEPSRSPYSTPELYKEYPLVLTSGQRSWEFFHSEHRQLPLHRFQHPYPCVDVHPEAAQANGLVEGEWCWIENDLGRCKQIVKFNDTLDPRVIRAEHGWWFPEESAAEPTLFKVFDSNINNLIPMFHNGPTGYGGPYKCQIAKIYPVTSENSDPSPTALVTNMGGFRDYSDANKNNYGNFGKYGASYPEGLIDYGI